MTFKGWKPMAKLYFKYGAMGSSKTAQALITKFNYEERGMKVWLIKPAIDNRDGRDVIKSRIGLFAYSTTIEKSESIFDLFRSEMSEADVIIADECQFFSPEQIDELRRIVDECSIPVLCFGLRTDFLTHSFHGSARLFEIADSISEIKTICSCGAKATVNARISDDGEILTEGEQILLGGEERYTAMCHKFYVKARNRKNGN